MSWRGLTSTATGDFDFRVEARFLDVAADVSRR
jgi:hypothetical protein